MISKKKKTPVARMYCYLKHQGASTQHKVAEQPTKRTQRRSKQGEGVDCGTGLDAKPGGGGSGGGGGGRRRRASRHVLVYIMLFLLVADFLCFASFYV